MFGKLILFYLTLLLIVSEKEFNVISKKSNSFYNALIKSCIVIYTRNFVFYVLKIYWTITIISFFVDIFIRYLVSK